MQSWRAPTADGPVRGTVALPGSKSLTNRLLVLAALADGPSRIDAPLRARDTLLMADALRALGVSIRDDGDDWVVTPGPLHGARVDTGLAGTIMRFVPPLAGLATGAVLVDGDPYARERPMSTLLHALRQVGVEVDDEGRATMPFTVHGTGAVPGGAVRIDASGSSQFVSGLLLAAPRFDKGVELSHVGERAVPSQPHLDMTVDLLRRAGVEVVAEPGRWQVQPGPIAAGAHTAEPDLSNAAPFLGAALITGGTVHIPGWPQRTTQPGDALRGLLARLGAEVSWEPAGLTVRGGASVAALDEDLRDVTELVTVLAVLAAVADGPSRLAGVGHMRGHETDRLAALRTELAGLGCDVTEEPDALLIRPRPLRGGPWRAYADHRMATAGALLGLVVPGIEIDDIGSTSKTLPDFPGMWSALVAG